MDILAAHIPNETRTTFMGELVKLKRMGVVKGLPDYIIHISAEQSICGRPLLLFVEMKRVGGVPSDVGKEQKYRLEVMRLVEDVETYVAYGHTEAIKFVCKYLDDPY